MGLFGFGKNKKKELTPQEAYEEGMRYYEAEDYDQAVDYIVEAAEAGLAEAQHRLGVMFDCGQGFYRDSKEAVMWYEAAAEQGYVKAYYSLGFYYYWDGTNEYDYREAFRWLTLAVEAGDSDSAEYLGKLYMEGRGCWKDTEKAIECWKKGAQLGDTSCMLELGDYYRDQRKREDALVWYLLAEQNCDARDLDYVRKRIAAVDEVSEEQQRKDELKRAREQALEAAKEWWQKECAEKYAGILDELRGEADEYLETPYVQASIFAVMEDYENAFKWYYLAAMKGNQIGTPMSELGTLCRKGQGVEKDLDKAEKFYLLASERGLEEARFGLGQVYMEREEYERAVEEYLPLAEKGIESAMYNLAICYGKIYHSGEEMKWYIRAAEKGLRKAMWNLALEYKRLKKGKEALKWASKLKAVGYPEAGKLCESIEAHRHDPYWWR